MMSVVAISLLSYFPFSAFVFHESSIWTLSWCLQAHGLVMSLEEKTALAEDLNTAIALAFVLCRKTTGKQQLHQSVYPWPCSEWLQGMKGCLLCVLACVCMSLTLLDLTDVGLCKQIQMFLDSCCLSEIFKQSKTPIVSFDTILRIKWSF